MGPGLKSFLSIYRYFYGENYKPSLRNNTALHVNAQNLYYLLSVFGMDINLRGYLHGYTWSENGPRSNRLECDLNSIDVKEEIINTFYSYDYDDQRLECCLLPETIEILKLLKDKFFTEEVNKLLTEANRRKKDWVKLLVKMAFIKNEKIPKGKFLDIVKELKKSYVWGGDKLNKLAWEALVKVGIINP